MINEVSFSWFTWIAQIITSLHKTCLWLEREWPLYWSTTGKWHQTISWSDAWLEALDISSVILGSNFYWFGLNGSMCCFIRQIVSIEIRGVTILLGNDGKMTPNYKLARYFLKGSYDVVSDNWIKLFLSSSLLKTNVMFF